MLVVIGILICLASLFAVLRPAHLLQLAGKLTITTTLRLIAFIVRVALGVFLILVAPSTDFSLALRIIGAVLIVSGVAVLVLGNEGAQRLVDWALRLGRSSVVIGGLVGLLFGAFLVYVGI